MTTGSKDFRPFLAFTSQPTRPLGAVLPAIVTPEVTSPWSPRAADAPDQPPPPAAPTIDAEALAEEARARGRTEGLEETAALRAQLVEVIDALTAARAALIAPAGDTIAEVCGAVIEAWTEIADRAALLAPVVRGWLAATDQPATARCHPDDAAALATLIGDAPLAIEVDPALAPGALAIRGAALEASHDWRARLPELRTRIAAALGGGA